MLYDYRDNVQPLKEIPKTNKLTIVLDSSQIFNFSSCNEYWNLSSNQQLVPLNDYFKETREMGTMGHAILDLYYKELAKREAPYTQCILPALKFDIDTYHCKCGRTREQHEYKAIDCTHFQAEPSLIPLAKRDLVRSTVRNYVYYYNGVGQDYIPLSPQSVEVGFSSKIFEDSERLYILEGRIDLIGTLAGTPLIVDHKFQGRASEVYKKKIQFKNYSLVTGYNTVSINYLRFNKEAKGTTFERKISSFSRLDHQVWYERLLRMYHKLADVFMYNGGIFDRNWSTCDGSWGYPCQFTEICEAPTAQMAEIKKAVNFKKGKYWSPW